MLYLPKGPYIIKSGKHVGQCLEIMIMRDYSFLVWLKRFLDSKKGKGGQKNELHRHLGWLLEQGENRQPKMFCPYCGERLVSFFALYRDYREEHAFDFNHAYCRDCFRDKCPPSTIRGEAFLFSFFGKKLNSWERSLAIKLFKEVFGLPERLTRGKAFEFFVNPDNRVP